jgi:hypothetical protein
MARPHDLQRHWPPRRTGYCVPADQQALRLSRLRRDEGIAEPEPSLVRRGFLPGKEAEIGFRETKETAKTVTAFQIAANAINEAIRPDADYSQQLVAAKCRGLMAGYDARWQNAGYVTISTEEVVESDLYNPDTQRKSRTFRAAGKLDVKAFEGNRLVLFDHKTTSEDIGDPAAPYWRQLIIEAQPSHYMLLEWLNGRKMDGAVWDVVRKPGISPRKLSKADITTLSITKEYCGREISAESVAELQRSEGRETLDMYEARLALDCVVERPQWYFQRKSVPRLDNEILEWAAELWIHGQEMLHARNTNRHPRNSEACMNYRTPCKFLGICSGYDTADSDKWMRKAQVHSELPILDGDGRDVLTNSRIKCFQLCRRKHYFTYELGIDRQDEEERESIFFGNLWHVGQQAWWNYFKGETNGNNNAGPPVTEAGTASSANETALTF